MSTRALDLGEPGTLVASKIGAGELLGDERANLRASATLIRTNAIDGAYVYPCSKRDVREAFGEGLLRKAWFGLTPDYLLDRRATHAPKTRGALPMHVTVNRGNEATLYVNRIRREDDSLFLRSRLRALMRGEMREWTERMVTRTETQVLGHQELLVEIRDGALLTHELRYL